MNRVAVVLMSVLALFGVDQARAAAFADQGAAYSACKAAEGIAVAHPNTLNAMPNSCSEISYTTINGVMAPKYTCSVATGANNTYAYSCNNYGGGVDGDFAWPAGKGCADRNGDGDGPPPGGFISAGSGGSLCFNGCAYNDGGGVAVTQWSFSGGQTLNFNEGTALRPTGAVCDENSGESPNEICQTQGTLTQCLMKNGKSCAVSSSGKRFCWGADETGTKVSGNEAATKAPEGKPNNPPPMPPTNNGNWEQTGTGSTSITNNNGETKNYTTNNYTSSSGSNGSGGGSTNPDGSENPPGDGEGDEPGNSVSGGAGCGQGNAPTCSGPTCTAEGFASLIQQWRARCADEDARGEFDNDANTGSANAGGDDEGGVVAGLWAGDQVIPSLDQNKLSIGGGSPLPSVQLYDTTWSVPDGWHDALAIIRQIIIAAFMVAAFVIVWNR